MLVLMTSSNLEKWDVRGPLSLADSIHELVWSLDLVQPNLAW